MIIFGFKIIKQIDFENELLRVKAFESDVSSALDRLDLCYSIATDVTIAHSILRRAIFQFGAKYTTPSHKERSRNAKLLRSISEKHMKANEPSAANALQNAARLIETQNVGFGK